jgi:hypothetical protein
MVLFFVFCFFRTLEHIDVIYTIKTHHEAKKRGADEYLRIIQCLVGFKKMLSHTNAHPMQVWLCPNLPYPNTKQIWREIIPCYEPEILRLHAISYSIFPFFCLASF